MAATVAAYLEGYLHEKEAFARFEAAGRHDLLRIARLEIGAAERAIVTPPPRPPGAVQAAAEAEADRTFAIGEAGDAMLEMMRLALQ